MLGVMYGLLYVIAIGVSKKEVFISPHLVFNEDTLTYITKFLHIIVYI